MQIDSGSIVKSPGGLVRAVNEESPGQWYCDNGQTYDADELEEPTLDEIRKKILDEADRAQLDRIFLPRGRH